MDIRDIELYKLHKQEVLNQGRRLSWVSKQLNCSYSLVHKYLNGHRNMSAEKVEKLNKILFG